MSVMTIALPKEMEKLPVDPKRGFVVPWFVQWITGIAIKRNPGVAMLWFSEGPEEYGCIHARIFK
jgi:hypothetical protein